MELPGLNGSGTTKLRTTLPIGNQNHMPFAAVDDQPDQQQQKEEEEEEAQPRAIEEEPAPSSPILRPMKWRVIVRLQSESSIKKSTKMNIKERTEKKVEMMVRSALSQTEPCENLEHPNPSRKQNRLKDPLFPGSGLPREITHSRYLVREPEDSINKKIDSSII